MNSNSVNKMVDKVTATNSTLQLDYYKGLYNYININSNVKNIITTITL